MVTLEYSLLLKSPLRLVRQKTELSVLKASYSCLNIDISNVGYCDQSQEKPIQIGRKVAVI